jgi:hypothetical protein
MSSPSPYLDGMNVAQKIRLEKDAHPERFCPDKRCLWRIVTALGTIACPRHVVTTTQPLTERDR